MFKRIVDHKYNELYKVKQQLVQELKSLNKKAGEDLKKENLQKQLNQAEKKFNDYLEKRKESYPNCVYCSQKISPSCLMINGCPSNYHNECWIVAKRIKDNSSSEAKKEKESNPYLFSKLERLETDLSVVKAFNKNLQKELDQIKKSLSNK